MEPGLDAGFVFCFDGREEAVEVADATFELIGGGVFVLQQNFAPQGGVAGGDAGRVAVAGGGEWEAAIAEGHGGCAGENMWEVGDFGDGLVVILRIVAMHAAAGGLPHLADDGSGLLWAVGVWRDGAVSALVQRWVSVSESLEVAACHGVAADEASACGKFCELGTDHGFG